MDEAARLSSAVGALYDAALAPGLWPAAVVEACDFVGGSAAAIFAKDAISHDLTVFHHDGRIDPHYMQAYRDRYLALDPSNTAHFFSSVESPVSTSDFIDYDEFLDTRFYREWAAPQGLADFLAVALEKAGSRAVMFGVFRSRAVGVADLETKRLMRLRAPHVRRAVLIDKAIAIKTEEDATLSGTLDGMANATFLVQASGRIVHANAAAHLLLAGSGFLYASGDRLTLANTKSHRALMDALTAAENGDGALGSRGVALRLADRDGAEYMAHLLPLTSGARRRAGSTYAAVAAIFIRKAALDLPALPEIIARHHGLTPSELRVMLAVIEVGGVPEVARTLGIAENTVKSHLAKVFSKTGTARQADLVKLAASFAGPIAA
jgi:DNA-binding CsgD family transcriptional regulator